MISMRIYNQMLSYRLRKMTWAGSQIGEFNFCAWAKRFDLCKNQSKAQSKRQSVCALIRRKVIGTFDCRYIWSEFFYRSFILFIMPAIGSKPNQRGNKRLDLSQLSFVQSLGFLCFFSFHSLMESDFLQAVKQNYTYGWNKS